MKIVVIGGTGLIGAKTVNLLRQGGHDVVAASRKNGIDIVTGAGLDAAMAGAQVVVDLSNVSSSDAQAVLAFLDTAGRNLLAAEETAGVHHHVGLSIVGVDNVPRPRLLPRQSRSRETGPGRPRSVLDHPGNTVPRIPGADCRCQYGRQHRYVA